MHAQLLAIPEILALALIFFTVSPARADPDPPFPTTLVFPPYFHSYGIQRATPAKLFMLLPFKTVFLNPQGLAVTKMTARDDTLTEEDDDEVTVYGVNSGRGEIIYNTSMHGITLWGKRGSGRGEMRDPKGVACDQAGNVFVCDAGNNRIVRLFNPDKRVQFVKHLGLGVLSHPTHIVLDGDGLLYVSDSGNNRILVMDREGVIRREIRSAGSSPVLSPSGVALNMRNERYFSHRPGKKTRSLKNTLCYHRRDYLFFLNNGGKTLVRLDLTDARAIQTGFSGLFRVEPAYEYMASDYYGNLYLTDIVRGTVDKFDINLNYIASFGKTGAGDREFDQPRGVCIWKWFGQTFIAEKEGAQYYWIGTDFSGVRVSTAVPGAYTLKGVLAEPSFLSLYLVRGKDTLQTLFSSIRVFPKEFNRSFGISLMEKENCGFLFVAEPTYSSYTYFKKTLFLRIP